MQIANFICRFGEKFVLLDLFEEVVMSAFTISKRKRTYSDAEYFLIGVKLVRFPDGELAFVGRHVKDTLIERDQILVNGEIKKDYIAIESAPTSFFVLLLSNHKLLYVQETAGAPNIAQFATTMGQFLGNAYSEWAREKYDRVNAEGRRLTWKQLREQYPPPTLEVTKIATESSVTAYVEKFRVINTVEVKVFSTNHELDNSPIFGEMREIKEEISADQVVLRSSRAGKVGLEKGGVAKLISSQAEDGNAQIVLRGTGLQGDKLTATNDSFNASFSIEQLPQSEINAAGKMYDLIRRQIGLGTISLREGGHATAQRIAEITKRYWQ